jgi:hypothetical protein
VIRALTGCLASLLIFTVAAGCAAIPAGATPAQSADSKA